jgi:hypothetical protein
VDRFWKDNEFVVAVLQMPYACVLVGVLFHLRCVFVGVTAIVLRLVSNHLCASNTI